jgi:hypothetical protein
VCDCGNRRSHPQGRVLQNGLTNLMCVIAEIVAVIGAAAVVNLRSRGEGKSPCPVLSVRA